MLNDEREPDTADQQDSENVEVGSEEAEATEPVAEDATSAGEPVAMPEPLPLVPLAPALEALLLATGEPLPSKIIAALVKRKPAEVEEALRELQSAYADDTHGILVIEIAGGWQLGTKPAHAPLIEKMLKEVRHVRLSPAALETLAIVAYRQPITRAEIEAIRGVNVDGVLNTLMDRELVKIVGRKEEVGRPLLFGTSEAFLMHFGLRSLTDLPPLAEFEEIARARADVAEDAPGPDWHALSDQQRVALEELQAAAEREFTGLDARLKSLKPPKLVAVESPPADAAEIAPSEPKPQG